VAFLVVAVVVLLGVCHAGWACYWAGNCHRLLSLGRLRRSLLDVGRRPRRSDSGSSM